MSDSNAYGTLFMPNFQDLSKVVAKTIPILETDPNNVLVLIDCLVDFIHKNGALPVKGAIEDTRRTGQFIVNNLSKIKNIEIMEDTHQIYQIFHAAYWTNKEGKHPDPFTVIKLDDLKTWTPKCELEWAITYLEKVGQLIIWPYHTFEGSIGRCVDPALLEILYYWSFVREQKLNFHAKGTLAESEMYGAFAPEVWIGNIPNGSFNQLLLGHLLTHEKMIFAGQAKSHCVLTTLQQICNRLRAFAPSRIKDIYVLTDCMSNVQHPEIDFDEITKIEFEKLAKYGMNFVTSTELEL